MFFDEFRTSILMTVTQVFIGEIVGCFVLEESGGDLCGYEMYLVWTVMHLNIN